MFISKWRIYPRNTQLRVLLHHPRSRTAFKYTYTFARWSPFKGSWHCVLEKIYAPNFWESRVHLWGSSRSNWIRAWLLVTKWEMCEKRGKVTAHCGMLFKVWKWEIASQLKRTWAIEHWTWEKTENLFYHLKPKPRVNDLSCNLFLVDLRNVS